MATPTSGGSGPLLVDVPGATPSSLVVQFGKDGNVYLTRSRESRWRRRTGSIVARFKQFDHSGRGQPIGRARAHTLFFVPAAPRLPRFESAPPTPPLLPPRGA